MTVTRRTALAGGLTAAALGTIPSVATAAPRRPGPAPKGTDRATLLRWATDTWHSMEAMLEPSTGLIADNIDADLTTRSRYTSPTNVGGYLWSTLVARDLGIINPGQANNRIRATLTSLQKMVHHDAAGMFFNWYDPRDGSVLTTWPENGNPVVPFVSSVDAAWLGAALLVVRNGGGGNRRLAARLFDAMRFDVFSDPTHSKPYLNYGGYYLEEPTALPSPPPTVSRDLIGEGREVWYTRDHHYDTIVSETRITTYLGIAKGQIPPSAYYQAWRTFPPDWDWQESIPVGEWHQYLGVDVYEGAYDYLGHLTVPGWGGSMFEELMPNVFVPEEDWAPRSWGRNHPRHVAVQRLHGMAEYGYWGFSPASHPAGGYSEWGVDALGLNPEGYFSDVERTNYSARTNPEPTFGDGVVTPHAAFLALLHEPAEAYANLVNLERDFDCYGTGGFHDAIATRSGQVARRHLSLDQAMIMGALGNVLAGGNLRRYFTRGEVERTLRPVIAPEVFAPLDGQ